MLDRNPLARLPHVMAYRFSEVEGAQRVTAKRCLQVVVDVLAARGKLREKLGAVDLRAHVAVSILSRSRPRR